MDKGKKKMKVKKIYKRNNQYAVNEVTETGKEYIACTSYTSHVASIVDGIMFIPKRYAKFSVTTSKHLSQMASNFQVKDRVVFDEKDHAQRSMLYMFFPEFN